jgi:hypothetical protein
MTWLPRPAREAAADCRLWRSGYSPGRPPGVPSEWSVTGLRRRAEQLSAPIHPLAADLSDPASLARLERDWDAVVYQATPGERSPPAYRQAYVEGLQTLLGRISRGD